jgi:hypothetical protein
VPRVAWCGDSSHTADGLLAGPTDGREDRSALTEAESVLEDILATGPVLSREVERQLKAAGVALPTARRAKARLGVRSVRAGWDGQWAWSLPSCEGDQGPQGNDHDHLREREQDPQPNKQIVLPKVITHCEGDHAKVIKDCEDDQDDHALCAGHPDHLRRPAEPGNGSADDVEVVL